MMHHTWTNFKGKDPVYAPFSFDEYQSLPLFRRVREQLYRSVLGLALLYLVEIWWKLEFKPESNAAPRNHREFFRDRFFVICYFLIELAVFSVVASMANKPMPLLVTFVMLMMRFMVFCYMMAFVTYLHHTHPEIPWFDRQEDWSFFQGQVAGTTHVQFPRIVELILLNILDHTAHHVDPLIPLYNLHTSQSALESKYPNAMKVIRWTPEVFFKTLQCCKLYDYRKHCWLDFNGLPTGPCLLQNTLDRESEYSTRSELADERPGQN